jgi:hypothetical protein
VARWRALFLLATAKLAGIRQDSDVDIGVLCRDVFYYDLPSGDVRETTASRQRAEQAA